MKNIEVLNKLKAGERLPALCQYAFAAESIAVTEQPKEDDKSIKVHVKMLPRTPVENTALGRCVYDLGTCRMPSKLALDDSHGDEIGYWRPQQTEYGIEGDGVVIADKGNPQHASNRVAYNLKNGIPQEASIDWRGAFDLGIIPEGETAQVNGADVAGPCFVIQNWSLRAGAICKAGMYSDTLTQAQLNSAGDLAPMPGKITTLGQTPAQTTGANMPEVTQTATVPVATPATTPAIQPVAPPPAVPQVAALGEAAKGEKVTILQACIAAVEKITCDIKQCLLDALKTAVGAIGQTNELDELRECAYYAKAVALECAEDDTTEDIAAAHACLKVCALVNDEYGWKICAAKDNTVYIPKANRPKVVQQCGDVVGHELHGNQYTGGGAGAEDKKKELTEKAEKASEKADKSGKKEDHEAAAKAHQEALDHRLKNATSKDGGRIAYHDAAQKFHSEAAGQQATAGVSSIQTATISATPAAKPTVDAGKPAEAAPVTVPQTATAPKVETPAPVVPPVVETPATTTQTATAPALTPEQQQAAQHIAKISELEARIAALGNGGSAAKPIPTGTGKPEAQIASFESALLKVKADHPQWSDTQHYQYARAQYKDVFEAEQKKFIAAQNGKGFGRA